MILILFQWMSGMAFGWTLIGDGIKGWESMRLRVHFNPSNCTVEESVLRGVIQDGVDTWNSSPGAGLKLELASEDATDGHTEYSNGNATQVPLILCDPLIGAHNSVDTEYVPAATRVSPGNGGHIDYSAIYLNAEEGSGAEISQLELGQLAITLTHEMGHALGLGHSSDRSALMYYSISDKTAAVLTEDDMDGLAFLYPKNDFNREPMGASCGAIHQPTTQVPIAGLILFIGWLFLTIGLGRFALRQKIARLFGLKAAFNRFKILAA